ncbi:hypothetical protein AB0C47_34755 [Micromonospora taraxaci]|uniref:hypothetical protein n=1 Tax=Micromonospora taraxaci TaxID=1316803 RepID=UPI0033DF85AC
MNLDRDSILNFNPVDPDLWEVAITSETETWTLPVIGFAVVVSYNGKEDGELSESTLSPVILDEEGLISSVQQYQNNWEVRPKWMLKRKI